MPEDSGDQRHALACPLHLSPAALCDIAIVWGCIMVAIKLPNVTATFFVTLIALMLIIGLLFWAVGTR